MLNRTALISLFALLFSQGCATNVRTPPAAEGLQTIQTPEAMGADTAKAGEPASAGRPALRVYKHPVTGEFTSPPPETLTPGAPVSDREAISTVPIPVMQETAIEGGGMKLDLQGRFRSYMSATKDAEGKVTVHCNDKPHAHPHNSKTKAAE